MNKISILGVNFTNYIKKELLKEIQNLLKQNKYHYCVTPNPEIVLLAQKDHKYKKILNQADFSIADGTGIIFASNYLKTPLKERIQGSDFTYDLLNIANKNSLKVYLLGSSPSSNSLASQIIKKSYPNLEVKGTSGPIIDKKEIIPTNPKIKSLIEDINLFKPDILLVAYGAPKQEFFMYELKDRLNTKLAIGIGGTLDYISNIIPRAPLFIRRLGLEWLYRLIHQPSRLGRIINAVIIFPIYVILKGRKGD